MSDFLAGMATADRLNSLESRLASLEGSQAQAPSASIAVSESAPIFEAPATDASNSGDGASEIVSDIIETPLEIVEAAADQATEAIGNAGELVEEAPEQALEIIQDAAETLADASEQVIEAAQDIIPEQTPNREHWLNKRVF